MNKKEYLVKKIFCLGLDETKKVVKELEKYSKQIKDYPYFWIIHKVYDIYPTFTVECILTMWQYNKEYLSDSLKRDLEDLKNLF